MTSEYSTKPEEGVYMKTKITVIVDNIDACGLAGEWGLCMIAEYGEKKIMIDTGASELFARNAKALGFELKDMDCAVLSHAHYDHSNGMARFFKENPTAPFYVRESTAENCYAKKFIFRKYIGIPRHILSEYPDRIKFACGDLQLFEGAYLIPHKTPGLEDIGMREMMYQKTDQGFKPDNFSHEQSLVLDTDKGLVIINSCSHGGAVNIINEVAATFPDKQVYGLIGGLHLFNKTESEVKEVAKRIKETGIKYVCTGHCTKDRAYNIMKKELGETLHQLHVGLVMEF